MKAEDVEKERRTAERLAAVEEVLIRIDALPKLGEPLTDADLYDDDGRPT